MSKVITAKITTLIAMIAVIFGSIIIIAPAPKAQAATGKNNSAEVNEMLDLLNDFRQDKGLGKVKVNTQISQVSVDWSAKMADTGNFKHNPNYASDSRIPAGKRAWGEIVAWNSMGDVEYLFNQWVNSPSHNAIMSNGAYNTVGIGLAYNSKGAIYGTINFYKYDKSLSTSVSDYPTFKDVMPTNMYYKEIENIAKQKITTGYDDGTYRPLDNVNRDAMIVFIYRAMGSPSYTPPKKSPFVDVSTNNMYYKEIAWAYDVGITKGWVTSKGREFRPVTPVKRDAMAAFLFRASGDNAPAYSSSAFKDVKKGPEHAAAMVWMKQKGISTGWSDGTYRAGENTKRDAMAAFLSRWTAKY